MRSNGNLWIIILSLWIVLCATSVVTAETWLIKPGEGLGPLRFGMSKKEAIRVLDSWKPKLVENTITIENKFYLDFDQGLSRITALTNSLESESERAEFRFGQIALVGSELSKYHRQLAGEVGQNGVSGRHYELKYHSLSYQYGLIEVHYDAYGQAHSFVLQTRDVLPNEALSSQEIKPPDQALKSKDFLQQAHDWLRAYEKEGRFDELSEAIDKVLANEALIRQGLEAAGTLLEIDWTIKESRFLNLILERGTDSQRSKLEKLIQDFPKSLSVRQTQSTIHPLVNYRRFRNLWPEALVFLRDESPRSVESSGQHIFLTFRWGVRVFDYEGGSLGNFAIPGYVYNSILIDRQLFVASQDGIFKLSLPEGLTKISSQSGHLVAEKRRLWFTSRGQAYRYNPETKLFTAFELGSAHLIEKSEEKIKVYGSNGTFEWQEEERCFRRVATEDYDSTRTIQSIKSKHLKNGAKYLEGQLKLADGRSIDLLKPQSPPDEYRQALVADGTNIWATLARNQIWQIDIQRAQVIIYPFYLYGSRRGLASKSGVYFFGNGGLHRFNKRSETFRWFPYPKGTSIREGVADGENVKLITYSGQVLLFDHSRGAFTPTDEIAPVETKARIEYPGNAAPLLQEKLSSTLRTKRGWWLLSPNGLVFEPHNTKREPHFSVSLAPVSLDARGHLKQAARRHKLEKNDTLSLRNALTCSNPYLVAKALQALPDGKNLPELLQTSNSSESKVQLALLDHLSTLTKDERLPILKLLEKSADSRHAHIIADGLAGCGVMPGSQLLALTAERIHYCPNLAYLMVDQPDERKFKEYVRTYNLRSRRVDFFPRVAERLKSDPKFAEELILLGKVYLLQDAPELRDTILLKLLTSEKPEELDRALEIIRRLKSSKFATPLWEHYLETKNSIVLHSFLSCAGPKHFPQLQQVWFSGRLARLRTLKVIVEKCPKLAESFLLELIDDEDLDVRKLVARGLAEATDRTRALAALRRIAKDPRLRSHTMRSRLLLGDPETELWFKKKFPQSLEQLTDLPQDVNLDFLSEKFNSISPNKMTNSMLEFAGSHGGLLSETSLLKMASSRYGSLQIIAARQLKDLKELDRLGQRSRHQSVVFACHIRSAELGDREARELLQSHVDKLINKKLSPCRDLLEELLEANSIDFLSADWRKVETLQEYVSLTDFRRLMARFPVAP